MAVKHVLMFVMVFSTLQVSFTKAETLEEHSINVIVDVITDLSAEIQDVVKQLTDRLPQILKDLEVSIKSIVKQVKIGEVLDKLKDDIGKLIKVGAAAAANCGKKANGEIEELNQKTQTATLDCVHESQGKTEEIKKQTQVLLTKATELSTDVTGRIQQCLTDHQVDAEGLSSCLVAQVEPIRKTLQGLKDEIQHIIQVTEDVAKDISASLDQCMQDLHEQVVNDAEDVVANVRQCLDKEL